MSQENVETVVGLRLAHDGKLVQRVRDDDMWTTWRVATAPAFHPELTTTVRLFGAQRSYAGIEGFRSFWLDWLAPWESYRIEIERAIDCGDRTLVVVRDFGLRPGSTEEVAATNSSVWTFDEGRIARIDFYPDPGEALKAVGLEE
jgi:ketosteroid isomerase-like protein